MAKVRPPGNTPKSPVNPQKTVLIISLWLFASFSVPWTDTLGVIVNTIFDFLFFVGGLVLSATFLANSLKKTTYDLDSQVVKVSFTNWIKFKIVCISLDAGKIYLKVI